jgi:hypothetical protein
MIKRTVNKAKNDKEAEEWDTLQQVLMIPEERQQVAEELRKRAYGDNPPDVREAHRNSKA